jgi:hypothetical protein
MTEDQARKLEVPIEWNGRANVCVYCGRVPETFYIVTGHDHTDDSIRWCICREAGQYKDEITTLRQRVAELKEDRSALMKSIHDQADRYDELSQELELSDALQRDKVVKLTAIPTDITQILDEVRKQERERCAALCEKSDRYRGDYFAAKIRAME